MALPDLFNDPVIQAVLVLTLFAVTYWQRHLTWPKYKRIHAFKRRTFPLLQRLWPRFIHTKGNYRNNAEYLTTRSQSVKAVWEQLVAEGGSPHVVCSLKRRQLPKAPPEYSAAHVVWEHDGGTQTECYLWDNGDGTTDVYAHSEAIPEDVDGHLEGEQTDGDPRGVVRDALGLEDA